MRLAARIVSGKKAKSLRDWGSPVLSLDYRGAPQTIGVMRQSAHRAQADPNVRSLAELVCQGLHSKAYRDEYLALYRFVLAHTRYMRDPRTVELVRSPSAVARTLLRGQTPSLDCDDMACFLAALILAVGGECRFVTVALRTLHHRGELQYSHVFAQGFDPQTKTWITLDPVAGTKTRQMRDRIRHWKFWPV